MKEIIAIIRPKKVGSTRDALVKLGYTCLTGIAVKGRGNQCGIAEELGVSVNSQSAGTLGVQYVLETAHLYVAATAEVAVLEATRGRRNPRLRGALAQLLEPRS